jgi:hypothetical protein
MKKIFTFLIAITIFGGSLYAQSFAFFKDGEQLENNAQIIITEFDSEPIEGENFVYISMESGLELKNLTETSIFTCFHQLVLEQPTGPGELTVCFGDNCNPPTNEEVTFQSDLEPGFDENFHLSYAALLPEGEYTRIKVQYDVFPRADPDDKATVIIIYDYSEVGIKELSRNDNVLVYERNGQTVFKFNKMSPDTQLVIYNITGREIGQYKLNSEKFVLPKPLAKGIYIYSVKEKGKVTCTGKYVQK